MIPIAAARFAYTVEAAFGAALGEPLLPWDRLTDEERGFWLDVAQACSRYATPAPLHEHWRLLWRDAGWSFGLHRDDDLKKHPDLLPYGELSAVRRARWAAFMALVRGLGGF